MHQNGAKCKFKFKSIHKAGERTRESYEPLTEEAKKEEYNTDLNKHLQQAARPLQYSSLCDILTKTVPKHCVKKTGKRRNQDWSEDTERLFKER